MSPHPHHEMCLSRCLCIHSHLQLVDLTLSAVLLHHGILPAPLAAVPQPPPHGIHKTLQGIQAIQSELRAVFRSHHRLSVSEVVLSVGAAPFRPLHLYRLPISICHSTDPSHEEHECGTACSELSPIEKRKVNLQLFRSLPPEEPRSSGLRLFVYVRGSDSLVSKNLEESDVSFMSEDKKCLASTVSFAHSGCQQRQNDDVIGKKELSRQDDQWLRVVPFIVTGKM